MRRASIANARYPDHRNIPIKGFLEATLAGPYDAEELFNLVWASPADLPPVDANNAVKFLEVIRDSIDAEGHNVSPV